jgi:hypothetical protein
MGAREKLIIETVEAVTNRLLGGVTCTLLGAQVIGEIGGVESAKRAWLMVKSHEIEKFAKRAVDNLNLSV